VISGSGELSEGLPGKIRCEYLSYPHREICFEKRCSRTLFYFRAQLVSMFYIAPVTLAFGHFRFRFPAPVRRQGAADFHFFFEFAFLVATEITPIARTGFEDGSFARLCGLFCSHFLSLRISPQIPMPEFSANARADPARRESQDMNAILQWWIEHLGLGVEPKDLTFFQTSFRGIVIFAAALIMIRLSDRRSLSKKSPFDIVLTVILASVLSRAINGNTSFFPTIGAAAVIVGLHRLLALVSSRWPAITGVLKGRPHSLVRDGQWQYHNLRKQQVAIDDVLEDLRLNAKVEELEKVKLAQLEASGDISFILKEEKARA